MNFVVEAAGCTGADLAYRIIVATDGCASDTEAQHHCFINAVLAETRTATAARGGPLVANGRTRAVR